MKRSSPLTTTVLTLLALAGLAPLSHAQRKAPVPSAPVVVGRSVVLPAKRGHELFRQCSRSGPENVTGYWTPKAGDLRKMEAALPGYLRTTKLPASVTASYIATAYHQCAGFRRGTRRFIYVNGFSANTKQQMEQVYPGQKGPRFDWKRDPAMVCDGGPQFFGFEYDVDTGKFAALYFNGVG
jgi:hypothetical protein